MHGRTAKTFKMRRGPDRRPGSFATRATPRDALTGSRRHLPECTPAARVAASYPPNGPNGFPAAGGLSPAGGPKGLPPSNGDGAGSEAPGGSAVGGAGVAGGSADWVVGAAGSVLSRRLRTIVSATGHAIVQCSKRPPRGRRSRRPGGDRGDATPSRHRSVGRARPSPRTPRRGRAPSRLIVYQ